jgi:hypothetical protein
VFVILWRGPTLDLLYEGDGNAPARAATPQPGAPGS